MFVYNILVGYLGFYLEAEALETELGLADLVTRDALKSTEKLHFFRAAN